MRKLFFVVIALLFAACTTDVTEDVAVESPETLRVSFEEDTRIQLMNGKTVWNTGDLVSVFYKSDANDCYRFAGNTGERTSELVRTAKGEKSRSGDHIITVYPYNKDYIVSLSAGTIEAHLPAEQTYINESYGIGSSPMVSLSEYKQVVLKNVCGWLKVQFTGDGEVVDRIILRGNSSEQVAGDIMIIAEDASSILASAGVSIDDTQVGGTLVDEQSILTEVSLVCPDGITLSSEPTSFYIALPPQKFSNGLSIKVLCDDGTTISKSTQNEIVIERNVIQPMEVLSITKPKPANNEIWYTSTDGEIVTPTETNVFGANIVSNTYEDGQGVITFDSIVTEIGMTAFSDCSSLTSITIPDSVTTIREEAFNSCSNLKEVYYQGDLSSWCKIEFKSPDANPLIYEAKLYFDNREVTDIIIPSDISSIGNYTFNGCTSLNSVSIHDTATKIGDYAFSRCTNLTRATIGNSVTEVGVSAFSFCPNLIDVIIGNSVTKIGESAFGICGMTSVTIPNSVTEIGIAAFSDCDNLISITIPNSVTKIGNIAFSKCDKLISATIPDSITEISRGMFLSCKSLTSVSIPNSVTIIGYQAFSGCSNLTNITIPDSVTEIRNRAFSYCTSLTSITIPNDITEIEHNAFADCSSLKEVYCKSTIPPSAYFGTYSTWNTFDNNASDRKIYVPASDDDSVINAYKAAAGWSDYAADIVEYNFTE